MVCQAFLPSIELREYIQCYQLRHFVFIDAAHLPFKPYAPRPEQTLVFSPRGYEVVEHVQTKTFIKRPQSYMMGQYVERTNRHLGATDCLIILVNFQPGVLYRITGIPFYQLTNQSIDAEAVFSTEIHMVNQRLSSTDDYAEMIRIIETFLLKLVQSIKREAHPLDVVANLMTSSPENTSVLQLAQSSFLGTRQFERKFKERMGISPKLFTRIARLTKAFRLKYKDPDLDWLTIALWCGYEDYQHMAKDFQAFAGENPTTYFLEDYKAPERYFGLRDSSM
jgi:AraC-like DNA-binding protein